MAVDRDHRLCTVRHLLTNAPNEPAKLVGSSEKIRRTLGWKPRASFADLVREMVEAELAAL